jgi:hypothetical protein
MNVKITFRCWFCGGAGADACEGEGHGQGQWRRDPDASGAGDRRKGHENPVEKVI